MPIGDPKTTISKPLLGCGETASLGISFLAASSLYEKPAEIVLVLDRSSGVTAPQLELARAAAHRFLDRLSDASSGNGDGSALHNGTRLGLVSFADTASEDVPRTEVVAQLHTAIDALQPSAAAPDHKAALEAAERALPGGAGVGSIRRVVVLFTAGTPAEAAAADPVAERLKAAGVELYCIGLLSDPARLNIWASDKKADHVAWTTDADKLEEVFGDITAEVVIAGVLDGEIRVELNPDFKLIRTEQVSDGSVLLTGERTLVWSLDAGLPQQPVTVSLSAEIGLSGASVGTREVLKSVTYQARDQFTLDFPALTVETDCADPGPDPNPDPNPGPTDLYPEPCPDPLSFEVDRCRDAASVRLTGVELPSLGRIVQVDAVVSNVCPGKRVAVAVLLTEVGPDGVEHPRGAKNILIPAQTGEQCRDVTIRCIPFVVPESLDLTGAPNTICNARTLKARAIANYVDTDFTCCDAHTVIL